MWLLPELLDSNFNIQLRKYARINTIKKDLRLTGLFY